MDIKPSTSTGEASVQLMKRHGGHRERIFTEPVMEVLLEQLGQHYYRIRDHLDKPQVVVTEIAEYMNNKIPGLSLTSVQVYGRMINLQNNLRRYWEAVQVGDYKKKPRYYEHLCKVFGTDINDGGCLESEFYDVTPSDELDESPNHITVELPEFFDANTVTATQYSTSNSSQSATFKTTSSRRDDVWTVDLTKILLQAIEECIDILRNRPDKFKAWKAITDAVNAHCDSPNPITVYQVKVKVKVMLAAVRKYDKQAARGQLFVVKPFYYDVIRRLFRKELKPYQRGNQSFVLDGIDNLSQARPQSVSVTTSLQSYMKKTTSMLEESLQIQREMREQMKDYHKNILDQFKIFNETYRMVALNTINNKQNNIDFEEVEELIEDENSDLEDCIVTQEYDEITEANVSDEMM